MPLTCLFVSVACYLLTDLSWLESALVGALLSPTDPVLTSAIINNKKVPERIRHSLNLESGLNDGLALPAVVTLIAALSLASGFVWWQFLLQDLLLGIGVGLTVAFIAIRAFPTTIASLADHNKSLLALGIVGTTYGLAAAVHGNGLIAVFVGSILFGIYRRDVNEAFEHMAKDIVELVKLAIFLFFGASLSLHILTGEGIGALMVVIIALVAARPLAILLSLIKTNLTLEEKLFMGWFGPKGIATIAFSLLVLANPNIEHREEIFHIAALAVVASIFAHGLSDSYGADWISKRKQTVDDQEPDTADTISPASQ
jgi:NhaP-type Na+/H+ or K+/H+ antiporter